MVVDFTQDSEIIKKLFSWANYISMSKLTCRTCGAFTQKKPSIQNDGQLLRRMCIGLDKSIYTNENGFSILKIQWTTFLANWLTQNTFSQLPSCETIMHHQRFPIKPAQL